MKPFQPKPMEQVKDKYISEFNISGLYMDSDADNMWFANLLYAELLEAENEYDEH